MANHQLLFIAWLCLLSTIDSQPAAPAVPLPPLQYPSTISSSQYFHSATGAYFFYYDTGNDGPTSFRGEQRDPSGAVSGYYGYIDLDGVLRITHYTAGVNGYRSSTTLRLSMASGTDDLDDQLESPKKGPTLSTSTSSFEPLDPHDPNISRLANDMFQKTSEFLLGELAATQQDYTLLDNMNRVAISKYADMKKIATNVEKCMIEVNEKHQQLLPYLEQIDQIEDSVNKLEQAAYKLDAYSKRLETQYKNLSKVKS